MRWPLRYQILLPMVGILLLTIGVVSVLNAALASLRVQRQITTELADLAETLHSTNFPLESNVLKQTRGLTGAEYVVVDSAGQARAASDDALRPLAEAAGTQPRALDLAHPVAAGDRRYLHAAVRLDRRAVGGQVSTLHVFYPEAPWHEARWQAVWPPLAIGGAVLVLVALAAYWLAAHLTQPIERLRAQVSRIGEGAFAAVPLPPRDDEIRDLAIAVNRMAEQLEIYETKARQSERLRTLGTLGGGIAHQIRNAATGCRIALDLHRRDCPLVATGPRNATEGVPYSADGDGPLEVAARQLEQIEAYIQRFLTLGRPSAIATAGAELADLVAEAIALVRPTATHLGVGIEWERPSLPLFVRADSPALVQLVSNLLVNAIEATAHTRVLAGPREAAASAEVPVSANDAVVVRLGRREGCAELAVGDAGPGPAPAIQPRLFEPFETDKPGGTGLGLVVARQIAADHGGSIRWERRGERTWFVVELPLLDGDA